MHGLASDADSAWPGIAIVRQAVDNGNATFAAMFEGRAMHGFSRLNVLPKSPFDRAFRRFVS
jgi:hypothetical protein